MPLNPERNFSLICVCICTYRRPALLRRTLDAVGRQDTASQFTHSIVVTDNDRDESARATVAEFGATVPISVVYCVEPEQNIALARNRALENARGDYVAFIDDDEFPASDWLSTMLRACQQTGAAGVLGPVRPFFDQQPPAWLIRGKFCERPEHETGTVLHWRQTRTGNVLFDRRILDGLDEPFDPRFGNGGEDQDFFRRLIQRGHRFVWCNEGIVHEVVPPERWQKSYYLKRAFLRGLNERLLLNAGSIAKSLIAIPGYALLLPFLCLVGQHLAMKFFIKLLDHTGKLVSALGWKSKEQKYLHA